MKTIIALLAALIILPAQAQTRLDIIQLGHPTLRQTARELTPSEVRSPEMQTLIDDMIHTMKQAGGVGLAAPQVNKSLRLFVMKSGTFSRPEVVINPVVDYLEEHGQQDSVEGCLSIPGRSLRVRRYKRLHMSYLNRRGEHVVEEVKGFRAIISQHEYDHLNGVLIVDLIDQANEYLDFAAYANAPLM
jgi:peptide deformylase